MTLAVVHIKATLQILDQALREALSPGALEKRLTAEPTQRHLYNLLQRDAALIDVLPLESRAEKDEDK
jgi:DNA-binding HxlR family transcriptional regulator